MDGLIAYALAKKYTDEHGGGGDAPKTIEASYGPYSTTEANVGDVFKNTTTGKYYVCTNVVPYPAPGSRLIAGRIITLKTTADLPASGFPTPSGNTVTVGQYNVNYVITNGRTVNVFYIDPYKIRITDGVYTCTLVNGSSTNYTGLTVSNFIGNNISPWFQGNFVLYFDRTTPGVSNLNSYDNIFPSYFRDWLFDNALDITGYGSIWRELIPETSNLENGKQLVIKNGKFEKDYAYVNNTDYTTGRTLVSRTSKYIPSIDTVNSDIFIYDYHITLNRGYESNTSMSPEPEDYGGDMAKQGLIHLFDGNSKTKWRVYIHRDYIASDNTYVGWMAPKPINVAKYSITTAYDTSNNTGALPTSWKLEAKHEWKDSWVTLATVTNDTTLPTTNNTEVEFDINPSYVGNTYRIFKLTFTSAAKSGYYLQLGAFKIIEEESKEVPPATAADANKVMQVDSNGRWVKDVSPAIIYHSGAGVPNSSVVAKVGDIYTDTTNNRIYQCTQYIPASSSLANLDITFNDVLDLDTKTSEYLLDFTCNGTTYERIVIYNNNKLCYRVGSTYTDVYTSEGWVSDEYKVIHVTGGSAVSDITLVNWVTNNATIEGVGSTWVKLVASSEPTILWEGELPGDGESHAIEPSDDFANYTYLMPVVKTPGGQVFTGPQAYLPLKTENGDTVYLTIQGFGQSSLEFVNFTLMWHMNGITLYRGIDGKSILRTLYLIGIK